MEDLTWSHHSVLDDRDAERSILNLSSIHRALEQWGMTHSYTPVINLDADSSIRIFGFAELALRRFAQVKKCNITARWVDRWDEVNTAFRGPLDTVRQVPTRLIHGDFNRRNVFLDTRRNMGMKVVDWEWMGVGHPHADLASAMKRSPWRFQQEQVREFFRHDDLPYDTHWEVYLWCRLVRTLVDAALHANQNLSSIGKTPSDVAWHLERLDEVMSRMARDLN
jgi:hypothetical protein